MFHNGVEKGKLPETPQEGDILVSLIVFIFQFIVVGVCLFLYFSLLLVLESVCFFISVYCCCWNLYIFFISVYCCCCWNLYVFIFHFIVVVVECFSLMTSGVINDQQLLVNYRYKKKREREKPSFRGRWLPWQVYSIKSVVNNSQVNRLMMLTLHGGEPACFNFVSARDHFICMSLQTR